MAFPFIPPLPLLRSMLSGASTPRARKQPPSLSSMVEIFTANAAVPADTIDLFFTRSKQAQDLGAITQLLDAMVKCSNHQGPSQGGVSMEVLSGCLFILEKKRMTEVERQQVGKLILNAGCKMVEWRAAAGLDLVRAVLGFFYPDVGRLGTVIGAGRDGFGLVLSMTLQAIHHQSKSADLKIVFGQCLFLCKVSKSLGAEIGQFYPVAIEIAFKLLQSDANGKSYLGMLAANVSHEHVKFWDLAMAQFQAGQAGKGRPFIDDASSTCLFRHLDLMMADPKDGTVKAFQRWADLLDPKSEHHSLVLIKMMLKMAQIRVQDNGAPWCQMLNHLRGGQSADAQTKRSTVKAGDISHNQWKLLIPYMATLKIPRTPLMESLFTSEAPKDLMNWAILQVRTLWGWHLVDTAIKYALGLPSTPESSHLCYYMGGQLYKQGGWNGASLLLEHSSRIDEHLRDTRSSLVHVEDLDTKLEHAAIAFARAGKMTRAVDLFQQAVIAWSQREVLMKQDRRLISIVNNWLSARKRVQGSEGMAGGATREQAKEVLTRFVLPCAHLYANGVLSLLGAEEISQNIDAQIELLRHPNDAIALLALIPDTDKPRRARVLAFLALATRSHANVPIDWPELHGLLDFMSAKDREACLLIGELHGHPCDMLKAPDTAIPEPEYSYHRARLAASLYLAHTIKNSPCKTRNASLGRVIRYISACRQVARCAVQSSYTSQAKQFLGQAKKMAREFHASDIVSEIEKELKAIEDLRSANLVDYADAQVVPSVRLVNLEQEPRVLTPESPANALLHAIYRADMEHALVERSRLIRQALQPTVDIPWILVAGLMELDRHPTPLPFPDAHDTVTEGPCQEEWLQGVTQLGAVFFESQRGDPVRNCLVLMGTHTIYYLTRAVLLVKHCEEPISVRIRQLEEILERSKQTMGMSTTSDQRDFEAEHSTIRDDEVMKRRRWWSERRSLDKSLAGLITAIEDEWVGPFARLLFGNHELAAADTTPLNTLLDMCVDRGATIPPVVHLAELLHVLGKSFGASEGSLLPMDPNEWRKHLLLDRMEIESDDLFSDGIANVFDNARKGEGSLGGGFFSSDQTLFLMLDKRAQIFPWESMSCLRETATIRCPFLLFNAPSPSPHTSSPPTPISTCHYILNPSGDLKDTQARMHPLLQTMCETGTLASVPAKEEILESIAKRDLFLYYGHAGGEVYCSPGDILGASTLGQPPVAHIWLIGCSSGKQRYGDTAQLDMESVTLCYLARGR